MPRGACNETVMHSVCLLHYFLKNAECIKGENVLFA